LLLERHIMATSMDQATSDLSSHIAHMIMKNLGGGGVPSHPFTLHFEGVITNGRSRPSDVGVQTVHVNLVRYERDRCENSLDS